MSRDPDEPLKAPFAGEDEARARDLWERPLGRSEFDALLRDAIASLEGEEGEELRELHAWFVRRYPTARERLAYVRRKTREAARSRSIFARAWPRPR